MKFFKRPRRLNLALQGGGVHGAFTWGVLDALLADERVAVGWLSGTSAGAVNAAAVAHGLASGGREAARETLAAVWLGVEKAGVPDLMRHFPLWSELVKASPLPGFTEFFSPYQFNPLGFDPLRKLLEQHIDFELVRRECPVDILIAATEVATGRARIFRRSSLTVDAVLASACLPTLHHAVEIDGAAYWDGGFSSNPDLLHLCAESPVSDTLLVQLNPLRRPRVPRTAQDIEDRVDTITFNQPLLKELQTLALAQSVGGGWFGGRRSVLARLARHRMHLIEAGRHTAGLGGDSKTMPDGALIAYLHDAGQGEALRWLERHFGSVGRRSTVDLQAKYFDAASPLGSPEEDVFAPPPAASGGSAAAPATTAPPQGQIAQGREK